MIFLTDETPMELPIFVTTTTLRELLEMQKGESLEEALAWRKDDKERIGSADQA